MGAIQYYAVKNGNLDKLTHGFNWQNEICGVSDRVVDRPFLFWCPPADPLSEWDMADGICVSSCPRGESMACPGHSESFQTNVSTPEGYEITTGIRRPLTIRDTYDSTPMAFYCVPDEVSESGAALAASFAGTLGNSSSLMQSFEGVRESKRFLGGVTLFAIFLGYAMMYLLNKFVSMLIKGLVFIVGFALFTLGAGFSFVGYCANSDCPDGTDILNGYVSDENIPAVGYGLGSIFSILFLVYVIVVCCCLKSSMDHTVEALEAACKLIEEMKTLVVLPLLQVTLKIAALSALVMGMCWVVSLGEPSPVVISEAGYNVQGVGRHFAYTDNQFYALLFYFFGCLWVIETITALGQFVISHAVVSHVENETHYYLPLLHGYKNCFKWHVGTIAFGGFCIGVLRFLSFILGIIEKATRDKEGKQNMVVSFLCCCCMCCLSCITDATELLNELVYTDCALTGSSYMTSAKNVVSLALTNPGTYGGVKFATEMIGFLGTAGLTFVGTWVPYKLLTNSFLTQVDPTLSAMDSQSQLAVTFVTFLISFFVSMAFMTSFNQCALTLMYIKLFDENEDEQKKTEEGYQKQDEKKDETP